MMKTLTPEQNNALCAFQRLHGVRVRRAEAKQLLDIADDATFKKVVDAVPELRHRLPGENQDKYSTLVIWMLRSESRCATCGEVRDNGGGKMPCRQ